MKAEVSIACFTAALLAAGAAPVRADTGGEAEIALQGSYLGDGASRLTDLTGVAAKFRTFLPGFGFLTANMETYGGESQFRTGENYVDLNGAAWRGLRWRLTGGDFRVATSLLPFPFTNIFFPELSAEGFKVEAASANRRYSLFYGVETLAAGPRIPFRIRVPQKALGGSVVETIGERLHVGARALYLSTNSDSTSSYLFAPGQESGTTATIAGDLLYKASENLEVFAEAAASGCRETVPSLRLSGCTGPLYRGRRRREVDVEERVLGPRAGRTDDAADRLGGEGFGGAPWDRPAVVIFLAQRDGRDAEEELVGAAHHHAGVRE